jgi:hypothetical protein
VGEAGSPARGYGRRQRRWEGSLGKDDETVAGAQALCGVAEGGDEIVLGGAEHDAHGLGGGVDEGCGRSVAGHWLLVRVLGEDGTSAENGPAGAGVAGVGDDAGEELGDPGAVETRVQMDPAGERREVDSFGLGEVCRSPPLAAATGFVEAGAVEPRTLQRLASKERLGAVDAGPVLRSLDPAG